MIPLTALKNATANTMPEVEERRGSTAGSTSGVAPARLRRTWCRANAPRPGIEATSIVAMLCEAIAPVHLGGEERSAELRRRCTELVLQSLPAPAPGPELPGEPPRDEELGARWMP